MPLTVLTDEDVRDVLETLTKDDIFTIHMALADALHSYSTANDSDDSGCCASNQPQRIHVKGKNGRTTLFMPATADKGMGVKIVSIAESNARSDAADMRGLSIDDSSTGSSSTISRTSTSSSSGMASSRTPYSSDQSSASPSSSTPRSSTPSQDSSTSSKPTAMADLGEYVGLKPPASTSPTGSMTLLDAEGRPRALLNASTLTAFRTALASNFIFKKRLNVHTLTVFGAGLQAYWHIYVALLLRGPEIHHLHLINRDFERAQRLLMTLGQSANEAVSGPFLSSSMKPTILTPEYREYSRLLKEYVRGADAMFCCTPSTTPLFPASYLTNSEGRRKARYIAAIGSYKPHMCELHEDILRQAVAGPQHSPGSSHSHLHLHQRHAQEGGAIVVDTIEGCMREAGEVIRAGIGGRGVVELGELVMLKREHWAEKAERERLQREDSLVAGERREREEKGHGHGHGIGHLFHWHHDSKEKEKHWDGYPRDGSDGGLSEWLERGNVIYKSVGLGLMDVVVGLEIVRLAEERKIGYTIPDF